MPMMPHDDRPGRRHASSRSLDPTGASGYGALHVAAVAIFLAGWLLFSWPWLTHTVTIPWDAKAHFLPQVQFLASSIAKSEWPFWTPYVFSGHPQIADPQSQMFSPPMLLLALLNPAPGNLAVDTTVLLCLLAAGLGVLWLFAEHRWHPIGGLVAAFGLAFGAAMSWRLQHYGQVVSLAWLPFALIFLKRALERPSWLWGLAAGVVSGFIVVGRDQVALLEVYLLAGFVVAFFVGRLDDLLPTLKASIAPLAAGAVGGIAVALVPVILTALLAGQSNRPEIDYTGAGAGSLHPALLLTAVAPNIYGAAGDAAAWWGPPSFTWTGTGLFTAQNVGVCYVGALALVLLVWGALRGVLVTREIRFYAIAFVAMLLYGLGWYTPAFRAMYELLPGVSLYRRPADAVFLIGGLGSIVAGYAMHALLSEARTHTPSPPGWRDAIPLALALSMIAAIALAYGRLGQASWQIGMAIGWIAAAFAAIRAAWWLAPIRPLAALAVVGAVAAADLAINNGPNGASGLPPADFDMLEPTSGNETIALLKQKVASSASDTRRDRVELVGLGFNWPNASLTHGLENTMGYNPVRLALYTAATGAEDHSGLPDQRKLSPLFPSYRSRLADLLGLRWIASGVPLEQIDKSLKPGDLGLIAMTKDGFVYENPRALPRVLFASQSRQADFAEMLTSGRWPDVDPSTTVLLESPTRADRPPGRVAIVSYTNTEVVIDAESPAGGWVVLNDVWQSWWRADVDGVPAPVLRANVIFRAVEVAAGKHRVRFIFRPFAGASSDLAGGGVKLDVPLRKH